MIADTWGSGQVSLGDAADLYRMMKTIRLFEETAADLHRKGLVPGPVHLSTGQEAVATGVSSVLRSDDRIVSTHRGHAHALAKGADAGRMLAELLGREDGYCKGKGGSMHLAAADVGLIGSNGIVAAGLPIAAGAALANRTRRTDQIVVGYFGDGAVSEGLFHETFTLSAEWGLPVVWICETNRRTHDEHDGAIIKLSESHGIPAEVVDGTDVIQVRAAADGAVQAARTGKPRLVEARTIRPTSHALWRGPSLPPSFSGDSVDPVARLSTQLEAVAGGTELRERADAAAASVIDDAVRFALSSPFPDPESALEDIYARVPGMYPGGQL